MTQYMQRLVSIGRQAVCVADFQIREGRAHRAYIDHIMLGIDEKIARLESRVECHGRELARWTMTARFHYVKPWAWQKFMDLEEKVQHHTKVETGMADFAKAVEARIDVV